jgi:hypothetical protein
MADCRGLIASDKANISNNISAHGQRPPDFKEKFRRIRIHPLSAMIEADSVNRETI